MTAKRERVAEALRGGTPDRPPYSFWTHFPLIDLDAERLAEETLAFARALDLDFVKAMPNGNFCVEDWGVVSDYSEVALGGVARVVSAAVAQPGDWAQIEPLDVRAGAFGRELDHLARTAQALGPDVPVLATAFSPLTVANKLSLGRCHPHLQTHPERVAAALGAIAATMADFARAAIEVGCAGIFFAVQDAVPNRISEESYQAFGRAFDLKVLAGAREGWFNVVHMHGDDVMFDLLAAYPVTALNWHIGETAPSIAEYRARGGTLPIVGGLRRMAITAGDEAAVAADLAAALAAGGTGLLVSPGCVIRHPIDWRLLGAVAERIKALRPL